MSGMPPKLGHLIGGLEVFDGEIEERLNPANINQVASLFHVGTAEHMDAAVAAAENTTSDWAATSRRVRGEVIRKAAALLENPDWQTRFADAMVTEVGKTRAGALGEVEKTRRILNYMSGLATDAEGDVIPSDQADVLLYTDSKPVGVAGIITPFNFPLAVTAWKVAPALIAGCPVVIKPSPAAPKSAQLFCKLLNEAIRQVAELSIEGEDAQRAINPKYLGLINLVHGGPDVVEAMVKNPAVQAISFTGSTEVGKILLKMAISERGDNPLDPRHFVAEMGGQNAIIVDKDADLEEAATQAVNGFAMGEGQRCTATSRFIVLEEVYEEFKRLVVEKTRALKIGPGSDPETQVGPLVSEQAVTKAINSIQAATRNGMELVIGGNALTEGIYKDGHYMEPTILEGNPDDESHLALRQEIFGPVAGLCKVQDIDEAIRVANETVGHKHAASIYTESRRSIGKVINRLEVGMVHVCRPTLGGDAQSGFGGMGGDTSLGIREMGKHALAPFLWDRTVDIDFGVGSESLDARSR
ncbi:MAG: aldehyde dehydrogenase family protein [bacterium]|nr:aldehyde dehydrogenase family protein [bacterium]